jgi:hypothetical protein
MHRTHEFRTPHQRAARRMRSGRRQYETEPDQRGGSVRIHRQLRSIAAAASANRPLAYAKSAGWRSARCPASPEGEHFPESVRLSRARSVRARDQAPSGTGVGGSSVASMTTGGCGRPDRQASTPDSRPSPAGPQVPDLPPRTVVSGGSCGQVPPRRLAPAPPATAKALCHAFEEPASGVGKDVVVAQYLQRAPTLLAPVGEHESG